MRIRPAFKKGGLSPKAFYVLAILIGCFALTASAAYGQLFRNFPLPFSKSQSGGLFQQLPQQLEQAGVQAVYNAVGKALGDDLPIRLDARTALPPVAPPTGFSPTVIACTAGNANMRLPPGDYTCQVRAYCTMDSIHRPGAGVPYELAPLQGKQAHAIATMFNRGAGANIAPQTLQTISWSIQASIPLSQMPPQHQAIVRQLIPEYERGLNGDFLQNVEATYAKFAPIAHLPPFGTMLDRMGGAGQTIKSILRSREIIRQNALHFDRLNEQLYDGPIGQEVVRPPYPLPSPWSQIRPGVIAQFVVQQGNLGFNTLNFRVLKPQQTGLLRDTLLQEAAYNVASEGNKGRELIAQGPAIPFELMYLAEIFETQTIAYSERIAAQALIISLLNTGMLPPVSAMSKGGRESGRNWATELAKSVAQQDGSDPCSVLSNMLSKAKIAGDSQQARDIVQAEKFMGCRNKQKRSE